MSDPKETAEYILGGIAQNVSELVKGQARIEVTLENQNRRIRKLENWRTWTIGVAIGTGLVGGGLTQYILDPPSFVNNTYPTQHTYPKEMSAPHGNHPSPSHPEGD